jgi:hypothetical protein
MSEKELSTLLADVKNDLGLKERIKALPTLMLLLHWSSRQGLISARHIVSGIKQSKLLRLLMSSWRGFQAGRTRINEWEQATD